MIDLNVPVIVIQAIDDWVWYLPDNCLIFIMELISYSGQCLYDAVAFSYLTPPDEYSYK